jgi:hypothetical protein
MHREHAMTFGTLLAVVVTVGCSGRMVDRGDVMLDHAPLPLGAITLEPTADSSGEVTGGLIQNGRYELSGRAAAKVGSYRVSITASPTSTGRLIQEETKPPGSLSPEMTGGIVAERFNVATTLTLDVVPGENVADFNVESK